MSSDPPRPGSRSERHQRKNKGRLQRSAPEAEGQGPATPEPMIPVIEPLRPEPHRTERRAEQRASRRGRQSKVAVALLAVSALLLVVIAAWTFLNRDKKKDAPTAKARTQSTLLVQLSLPSEGAASSALIAVDAEAGTASMTLVPSRLITQMPGYGDGVFGSALHLGGPQLAADTIGNQLGVLVDGTWTLTPQGLAALVDGLAPVSIEVDAEIGPVKSGDGAPVLSAGVQPLDGAAASGYALYQGAEETDLDRTARLQLVLDGVLDALPKEAAQITPKLPPAPASKTTLEPARLAETLRAVAEIKAAGKLTETLLPVVDIDTGAEQKTYRLDTKGLEPILTTDLAGSVPPNPYRPSNRVVVRNGVGTVGIGQGVTHKLNAGGFVVVQSGNADSFGYAATVVQVFDSSTRAGEEGRAVAALLGVSDEAVEVSDVEQSVADVIVIVGADYTP